MVFCDDIIAAMEDGRSFNEKAFDEKLRYFEVRWTEPSDVEIEYRQPQDAV
jgi:hypothetical protein